MSVLPVLSSFEDVFDVQVLEGGTCVLGEFEEHVSIQCVGYISSVSAIRLWPEYDLDGPVELVLSEDFVPTVLGGGGETVCAFNSESEDSLQCMCFQSF